MAERKIQLEISDDRMQAAITIPAEEKYLAMKPMDVINILTANKVVGGVLEEDISNLLTNRMFNRKVVVARGGKPQKGDDAAVSYRYERQQKLSEIMAAAGDDLKLFEVEWIRKVIEGQEIATKTPAQQGTPGCLVTGEVLEAQDGVDVELKGSGVRISQDGLRMLADTNGQVVIGDDSVTVVPLFSVEHDVDRTVGNIDFDGSVLIKGSVDGFTVKAAGDVEICGNVGRTTIEAGGDIFIKGGIQGKGESSITSRNGSIACKFIESAQLHAGGGDILVNGHIMSSTLEARRSIIADGRKSTIVGGRIAAYEKIRAGSIGSRDNVVTRVEVASPVLQKKWQEEQRQVLEPGILKAYDMLKRIKDALGKLQEKKDENQGTLLPKEAAMYAKLGKEQERIQAELEVNLEKLEEMKKGMDTSRMVVEVLSTVYVGVSIQIGDAREDLNQPLESIRFIRYGDQINPERL